MSKGFQSPGGSVASDSAPQAESVPVRVLATVHVLPGVAQLPVMNPRRRGRYPQRVTPIWRARNRRRNADEATALAAAEAERGWLDGVACVRKHLQAVRRRRRGLLHALLYLPLGAQGSPAFEARAVLVEEAALCAEAAECFLVALSRLGAKE